jgi:hypothetical protein
MKNNLKFLKKSWLNVFLYCIVSYLCVTIERNGIINTQNFKIMYFDLNTTSKQDFVNFLILSDDVSGFYNPREQKLLSLDFNFEDMKIEFENWLEMNCDNF